MNTFYVIAAVLASAHAFTFGRWLIKHGNKAGAFFVYVVTGICLALPVLRILMAP
ncbi:MAG: hypothetical protein P4N59_10865 [Negativicutes bacterium]|nr:hypothetical protein [Negativicutes bacterium]